MDNSVALIQELFQKYARQLEEEKDKLKIYDKEHPTVVLSTECMDERVKPVLFTNTLIGVVKQLPMVGGKWDTGWPMVHERMKSYLALADSRGSKVLMLTTYHFSGSDPDGSRHLGCAGFSHDTKKAVAYVNRFRLDVERDYHSYGVVPILVGIDTDTDGFVFHGNGHKLDIGNLPEIHERYLERELRVLYPTMPDQVFADLLPLVKGNLSHVKEVRKTQRAPEELDHGGYIIAIGEREGLGIFRRRNLALKINPCATDNNRPIHTAAKVIGSNFATGRVQRDNFLVACCFSADDRREMMVKLSQANHMGRVAEKVIERNYPELVPKMHRLHAVINRKKMELSIFFRKGDGKKADKELLIAA